MKYPKVGIISQARMTSTRLPGKILKEANEIPLLQFHLNRLKDSGFPVIIATTTNHTDDPVIEVCTQNQVPFYRGDEDNVLERFYGAATEHNLEIVIRVTSDCPLIDGNIIQKAVQEFIEADDQMLYMSNGLSKTFPRGFDFEIFRYNLLKEAYEKADEQFEKEHVTPYLYTGKNPAINTKGFAYPKDYSAYRITVDTEDDLRLVQKLIEEFEADKKGIAQIIEIFNKNPDLVKMNAHIEQKKLNE